MLLPERLMLLWECGNEIFAGRGVATEKAQVQIEAMLFLIY